MPCSRSSPASRQPCVPPSNDMTGFWMPAVSSDAAPRMPRVRPAHEPTTTAPASDAVDGGDQHHPAWAPRPQLAGPKLESTIRQADREQRVPRAVLAILAHVDKGNLATVAKPAPHSRDIDRGDIRHLASS